MKTATKPFRCFRVLIVAAALSLSAAAQDPTSQIKAEIARLQKSVKSEPISDPSF